jgi:hypothetical protein
MGLVMHPSNPALSDVGQAIASHRDTLIAQWSHWISERMTQAPHIDRPTVDRHLALLVDVTVEMTGPLRRIISDVWFSSCDAYGRTAAARGLAAGEVVEEMQYFRELLIRTLPQVIAGMGDRQIMALVLRLNAILDKGIAHAVVGYTDALVETLFNQQGVPFTTMDPQEAEVRRRLEELEEEFAQLRAKRGWKPTGGD